MYNPPKNFLNHRGENNQQQPGVYKEKTRLTVVSPAIKFSSFDGWIFHVVIRFHHHHARPQHSQYYKFVLCRWPVEFGFPSSSTVTQVRKSRPFLLFFNA